MVGRVQNVGFRWWTARQARALGLAGTVRNLADGSVEVVAAGRIEALDRLAAFLGVGPPGADVERVEPLEPSGESITDTFEIMG